MSDLLQKSDARPVALWANMGKHAGMIYMVSIHHVYTSCIHDINDLHTWYT